MKKNNKKHTLITIVMSRVRHDGDETSFPDAHTWKTDSKVTMTTSSATTLHFKPYHHTALVFPAITPPLYPMTGFANTFQS